MSGLLTIDAIKELPSSTLENLQTKILDKINMIETNIQLETEHIKRYQEFAETLKETTQQKIEIPRFSPNQQVVELQDKKGIALTRQTKIDNHNFPFTLNTSIGCHFGCLYCYTQTAPFKFHTIFGQQVKVKMWIAEQLDKELKKYSHLPQHLTPIFTAGQIDIISP